MLNGQLFQGLPILSRAQGGVNFNVGLLRQQRFNSGSNNGSASPSTPVFVQNPAAQVQPATVVYAAVQSPPSAPNAPIATAYAVGPNEKY
jgi:hypothetical protein